MNYAYIPLRCFPRFRIAKPEVEANPAQQFEHENAPIVAGSSMFRQRFAPKWNRRLTPTSLRKIGLSLGYSR